jgi:hypothetical protein
LNWGDDATVVKPHESAKAVRKAATNSPHFFLVFIPRSDKKGLLLHFWFDGQGHQFQRLLRLS